MVTKRNRPFVVVGKTKLIESKRTAFQYIQAVKMMKVTRNLNMMTLGVNINIQLLLKLALLRKQEKVDLFRLVKISKKPFH